jgi:hypothetical protein
MEIVDADGITFVTQQGLVLVREKFNRWQSWTRQGKEDRITPNFPRMR